MTDFPEPVSSRPLWLITLADLALLLVGFFVLLQATQHIGGKALAQGMREGFGETAKPTPPMPVASTGVLDFAPGSAVVPGSTAALIAFAQDAAHDPRVQITVTGSVDGSAADVDPATQSGAILAADRARAVAAIVAPVAPNRVAILTSASSGRRAAMVTLAFVGEPASNSHGK